MTAFISHPSLVLGHVADPRVLDFLRQIQNYQSQTEAAQEKLNSLIQLKRSMTLTLNELLDMQIDVSAIQQKLKANDTAISEAAQTYLDIRIQNEEAIQQLRQQLNDLPPRPDLGELLDLSASKLEIRPYFSESLKLDSQYFSFGSNFQDNTLANVEKFIRTNTATLDSTHADDLAHAASSQINNQLNNHNLCGTLILVANCTHRNISIFNPLVIDPDKAIKVWNALYEGNKIDKQALQPGQIPEETGPEEDSISLITGATYGSGFIGMVHMLQSDSSQTGNFDTLKKQLDQKLKIGGWLENAIGGFGIHPDFLNEVKAFLSTQSVSSHVSVIATGAIPSLKANSLHLHLDKLAQTNPQTLSSILTSESQDTRSTASDARQSSEKALSVNLQNARLQGLVTSLGQIDHGSNSVLDINSLMQALDNYIQTISTDNKLVGVPIGFHTQKITKTEIIRLWLKKYYPPQET